MSQYKTGSVAVTNNSNEIIGTGTAWLTNVVEGAVFSVLSSGVPYIAADVVDNTHITLASDYGGPTLSGLAYRITNSFTPNINLPYMEAGDVDTHTINKRSMLLLDELFAPGGEGLADPSAIFFTDSVTGAVQTNLSAYLNLKVKGLRKTFGAPNDGIGDALAALNKGFALDGKILEIEEGDYLLSANPNNPNCSQLIGWDPLVSRLIAGPAVTRVLRTGSTGFTGLLCELRNFGIVGNNTPDARGIIFADGSLGPHVLCTNLRVVDFIGEDAIGVWFRDSVEHTLIRCDFLHNYQNIHFQGGGVSGAPTTVFFYGGSSQLATGPNAIVMKMGTGCRFQDYVMQSNSGNALLVYPSEDPGGDVTHLLLDNVWFEGNWDYDPDEYNMRVITDGGAGGRTANLTLRHCLFGAGARALYMTGAGTSAEIDYLTMPSVANQVVVDNVGGQAGGKVIDWGNTNPAITLNDPSGSFSGVLWSAYTPDFFSSLAEASPFPSVTALARFVRSNNVLNLHLEFSGSISGAPTYIEASIPPAAYAFAGTWPKTPACIINNGVPEIGFCASSGGSRLRFSRIGGAAFTASAIAGASVSATWALE